MVKQPQSLPADDGGPWHPGELELQRRAGAAERMAEIGRRHLYASMPDQHRAFYAQLPFVLIGTLDDTGNPWAGMRVGEPGFVSSPDPGRLLISGTGMADDPMEAGLRDAAPVGLLGIELHTRRRNRMNGVAHRLREDLVEIEVDQAFGNCPQYIQQRRIAILPRVPGPAEELRGLDEPARILIETADTFFVATHADRLQGRQVDISHRGGRPGFVAVEEDGALTIPDFAGNHFFATLGNILLTGRAGLLFVDFSEGTLLQMTGRAGILPGEHRIEAFRGAERFWCFRPERVVRRRHALPMRFAFDEYSPRSLATGTWKEADARQRLLPEPADATEGRD